MKRSLLIAFALLMAGLILLAGFSYVEHQRLNQLSTEYERLQGLLESLLDLENAILTDEYTINGSASHSVGRSPLGYIGTVSFSDYVIYSLASDSNLEIELALRKPIPPKAYLPLSVWREEDVPIPLSQVATDQTNETAVLMWEANVTRSGTFSIRLPLTGWHVISIHGPVNVPEEIETITIPYTLTIRMKRLGEYVSFIVCPKLSTPAPTPIRLPKQELNATLSLNKKEFMSREILELIIRNEGSTTLFFGLYYTIEYLGDDGKWREAPWLYSGIWYDIGISLQPGKLYVQSIELFPVLAGTYRISKEVSAEGTDISTTLTETFTVIQGTPKEELPRARFPEEIWNELRKFCEENVPDDLKKEYVIDRLKDIVRKAIEQVDPEGRMFVAYGGVEKFTLWVRHATKEFIDRWPKECHGVPIEINVVFWALDEAQGPLGSADQQDCFLKTGTV